jgi:hypothetical protein
MNKLLIILMSIATSILSFTTTQDTLQARYTFKGDTATARIDSIKARALHITDLAHISREKLDSTLEIHGIDNGFVPESGNIHLYATPDDGFIVIETITDLGIKTRVNQDIFRIARNTSGEEIPAGCPVRYTGSSGNKPNFGLAKANILDSMAAIGITIAAVADNGFGVLMIMGRWVGKTDYSGWAEGDELWVSPYVAGELVDSVPEPPCIIQWVGTIEVVHSSQGAILINAQSMTGVEKGTIQNMFSIGDGLAGNKLLIFNGATKDTIWWDGVTLHLGESVTVDTVHGVTDSAAVCHIADTALHWNDSVSNCHKADTAIKAQRCIFADSSTNTHKADTAIKAQHAIIADSSAAANHSWRLTNARTIGGISFDGTANIVPDTSKGAKYWGGFAMPSPSTGWLKYNGGLSWATPTYGDVGAIGGSGTSGYIPKFTGTNTIGNSLISDNSTYASIIKGSSGTFFNFDDGDLGTDIILEPTTNDRTVRFTNNSSLTTGGFEFYNTDASSSLMKIQNDGRIIGRIDSATGSKYWGGHLWPPDTALDAGKLGGQLPSYYAPALVGTDNYLLKKNGVNTAASIIYDNGTNICIGGTSPNGRIDIKGTNAALCFTRDAGDRYGSLFYNDNYLVIRQPTNDGVQIQKMDGTPLITIPADGSMEIGTSTKIVPDITLSSGARTLRFNNSTSAQDEGFQFYNSNDSRVLLTILQSGYNGILTASPGGALDVRGTLSLFGSTQGGTYINENELNFKYTVNNNATGYINYNGYAGGATQFRDLGIYDGKGSLVVFVDGSEKRVGINGIGSPTCELDVNGQINADIMTTGSFYSAGIADDESSVTISSDTIELSVEDDGITSEYLNVNGHFQTNCNSTLGGVVKYVASNITITGSSYDYDVSTGKSFISVTNNYGAFATLNLNNGEAGQIVIIYAYDCTYGINVNLGTLGTKQMIDNMAQQFICYDADEWQVVPSSP